MISLNEPCSDRLPHYARIVGLLGAFLVCSSILPAVAAGLPGKKRLDWLETFLKEYSEAAHSMCTGGKFLGCEVADGAQVALRTFQDARKDCSNGDQAACDQIAEMAPQIAAQTTDACLQFKLKDCPKQPELTPDADNEGTRPPAGYFDYQGEQLPGFVPSTQGPPPGLR